MSPLVGNAAQDDSSATVGEATEQDMASLFSSSIRAVMDIDKWPCVYSGHFKQQRSLTGTNVTLTSTGQFLYSCDQGLLWEMHKPGIESVVYTHAERHFQVRSGGRVKPLTGLVQSRVGKLLLSLLGGDSAELSEDFDAQLDPSQPNLITLTPRKISLQQHIQKITLNSEKGIMQVGIQAATSGNVDIQINQLVIPTQLPVVACASISLHADQACRLLFDQSQ